jgi:hypothetical protein
MERNSCPRKTFQKFEFPALGSLFFHIYRKKKLVKEKHKLQLTILLWIKGGKKNKIHTHTNKSEIKFCVITVTINFSS